MYSLYLRYWLLIISENKKWYDVVCVFFGNNRIWAYSFGIPPFLRKFTYSCRKILTKFCMSHRVTTCKKLKFWLVASLTFSDQIEQPFNFQDLWKYCHVQFMSHSIENTSVRLSRVRVRKNPRALSARAWPNTVEHYQLHRKFC